MVPESVLCLQESMQDEYGPLILKWEDDVKVWDLKKKKQDDEAFEKCVTPGQKANVDVDRFMNYYFLTNGRPDPSKTPKPLALYGLKDRMEVYITTHRIDGLRATNGGFYGERTICIGWDSEDLHSFAREVAKEDEKAQKEKQDAKWEKDMEMHQQYVSDLQKNSLSRCNQDKKSKDRTLFYLHRCRGSYIVKCDPVRDEWPNDAENGFTLDISESMGEVLIASFNFGVIEGTMLLSTSEASLEAYGRTAPEPEPEFMSESELSDSDDPDTKKRHELKRTLARAAVLTKYKNIRSMKRRRVAPSESRRVYFRIRGQEVGEGDIFDTESGHIEFLSDDCAAFTGLAYWFPYFAKDVEFKGYKVSDTPRRTAERWESF